MIETLRLNLEVERMMQAAGELSVVWTPNKDWGDQMFMVRGEHYKRATQRETPHLELETKYGEMRLRRMSKWEIDQIGKPIFEDLQKARKQRRKKR